MAFSTQLEPERGSDRGASGRNQQKLGHRPGMTRRWVGRYAAAPLAVGIAVVVRLVLTAWAGPGLPMFITFYPAVMLVALLAGFGPGLLTTALAAFAADLWFIEAVGTLKIARLVDGVGLVLFLFMGCFMCTVAEWLRRSREKAIAYDHNQALAETRRQNEFLAGLVERASQAFGVGYPDGRLGLVNPAFEQLTGYTAAELRSLDWTTRLTPPEWRQLEKEKLEELHRTGQPVRYEKEYIRKDGARVPIELLVHLARDQEGKPEYYFSLLTDITERKRAEEALRRSEQRVRMRLESVLSPEGDIGNLELEDILDVPAVQGLMEDFYALAETPMGLIDLKGKVLVGVGWQDICTQFHRLHPETCQHCIESDTLLSAGVAQGQFKLYKCKNNLWDMATPIMIGGKHMGNLFLGQFFFEDEAVDRETFVGQARKYGFSEAAYMTALEKAPRLSRQAVDRAMAYFSKLADMLSKLSYSNLALARSLTERERNAEELRRLNRTLKALSDSNQAMMRSADEATYLNEVCQIIVQDCGHAMVWIGFAEQDEARTVRPAASAGFEEGYLETLRITWADDERGRGPTGTAIRTGRPAQCRNMQTDPAFAPWREQALKRGYHSSLVLPLLAEGKAFGSITIYSGQPDGFSDDEASLLTELAGDLSHGIIALRLRAERKKAEEQLRLLSTAVASAVNGIAITDRKGQILWTNPAFSSLTGYSQEDSVGQTPRMLKSGQHPPEFYREMWATILRGEPWQGEMINRRKDGSLYTEEMAIAPVRAAGTDITHFVAIKQDVTARKRAEKRTDLLAQTAGELLSAESPQRVIERLCRRVLEFLDCQFFFNFLVDEAAGRLRLNACAGIPEPEVRRIEWLDYGVAVCGCVARDACRIVAEDIQQQPDPRTELVRTYGVQAYACHPLMVQGRVIGTLSFGTSKRARYTDDELSLMKAVTDQVAIAMERQQAQIALRKANEELEARVTARTASLHAAERYARSLLEASLDPLVTISHEGKITDVNLATELVTGLSRSQLVGSDFSKYFTEPQQAEAGYQKVLEDGAVSNYPLTIRHVSGHTTDVLYNATVYRNEAGEVQGVFAAARDITERKQAERRRDFTNALLSLFAQKATISEYLDSVVETVRQWSDAQAMGVRLTVDHEEIPYKSWAGFEPGFLELEDRLSLQRDQCLCIRAASGRVAEPDRPLLTRGGSFRTDDSIAFAQGLAAEAQACYRSSCMKFGFASLAVIPIRYRERVIGTIHLADKRQAQFPLEMVEFIESMTPLIGEAVHRFQTEAELAEHRDHLEVLVKQRTGELETANAQLQAEIAERRRAQEALQHAAEDLRRSNRDLEQFAYVASHDLQEPLRAVGGYVKLLERRFPENLDPKAKEFITGAAEGASRMERLITDLLAFSRVGTRGGGFAPADFNAVLEDALRNLQLSIQAAQAKVTHDRLPVLQADSTQMTQLFQNLIGNALKFRGERQPEIHIGARKESDRWVFSVSDNGIGMEPQYFERIFQIFQRLHTRKHYPGTGIGLAICKKIVERHGGAIWVESQPEQGSTFRFSIPDSGPLQLV